MIKHAGMYTCGILLNQVKIMPATILIMISHIRDHPKRLIAQCLVYDFPDQPGKFR